jgi:hypothetical protein
MGRMPLRTWKMRALLLAAGVALAAAPFATTATGVPPADVSVQAHPSQFCCPYETGYWDG